VDAPAGDPARHAQVRALAALSESNRYRIVELLAAQADLSCSAIARRLGLSASLLTHHLGVLEAAGIIERHQNALCTLNRLRRDVLAERLAGLQRLVAPEESSPAN
jgi:DNA-binding transcriptional ArsR family regulator